jgi:hypothetical protein
MSRNVPDDIKDLVWTDEEVAAGTKAAAKSTTPRKARAKSRRELFEAGWVKFPRHCAKTLSRAKSKNTIILYHELLFAAFDGLLKGKDEIELSAVAPKMPRNTRLRGAKELADIGLIEIKQEGKGPVRISLAAFRFLQLQERFR